MSFIRVLPALSLLASNPVAALYQEYQLAGSIAAAPSYSFATGQYRLYDSQVLLRKDFLAFEYDLDSLYADYAYGLSPYFRLGVSGKAHIFDYQNLNHIVDASSGAENKSISLNSPYYRGNLFLEGRYHALALRYLVGAQRYELAKRETSNTALTVSSPDTALVQQVALGYWNIVAPRPYAINGVSAFASIEAQQMQRSYTWELSGVPLSNPQTKVVISELHVRAGDEYRGGALRLMAAARAGATSFSLPGEKQDVVQSFSVGGPESRYRRVAGYAFSEFRAPAFGLLNLDAIIHGAGPVNLWLIADCAVFDREYNSRRYHAGAGVGMLLDLPQGVLGSRSALFARIEAPFFAAGGNRFQVFLGLNGQIF